MPSGKKLKHPSKEMKKSPGRKLLGRKMVETKNSVSDKGQRQVSQIPVAKKRGRPSLAAKFNPTVDIKDALYGLKKGFFSGNEKELFKTPLKGKLAMDDVQTQRSSGDRSGAQKSTKSKRSIDSVSSSSSPGSLKPAVSSSPGSPYFLRSKGPTSDPLLLPERARKSKSSDSPEDSRRRNSRLSLHRSEKATGMKKDLAQVKDSGVSTNSNQSENLEDSLPDKPIVGRGIQKGRTSKERKVQPFTLIKPSAKPLKDGGSLYSDEVSEMLMMKSPTNVKISVPEIEKTKKRKREDDEDGRIDDILRKSLKVTIVDTSGSKRVAKRADTGQNLVITAEPVKNSKERCETFDRDGFKSEKGKWKERHGKDTSQSSVDENYENGQLPSVMKTTTTNISRSNIVVSEDLPQFLTRSENGFRSCMENSVQQSWKAPGDLESMENYSNADDAERHIRQLTADISARSSWSAHLYEKDSLPQRIFKQAEHRATRPSADEERPCPTAPLSQRILQLGKDKDASLSADEERHEEIPFPTTPTKQSKASDFQMIWDTSAVKNQLLSSIIPRRMQAVGDEPEIISNTASSKKRISEFCLHEVSKEPDKSLVLQGDVTPSRTSSGLAGSGQNVESIRKTPAADPLSFGTDTAKSFRLRRDKNGSAVKHIETRTPAKLSVLAAMPALQSKPSSKTADCQQRFVDKMLPSSEPDTLLLESVKARNPISTHPPGLNGKVVPDGEKKLIVKMNRSCGSRLCRRLLCAVGTPLLVAGIGCLSYLALAAGYLGEFDFSP